MRNFGMGEHLLLRELALAASFSTFVLLLSLTGCDPLGLPGNSVQGSVSTFVFENSPSFASCHASTVVSDTNGELLCAWFGGSGEGHDDVAIWGARFLDGHWTEPAQWAKVRDEAHWNPVLFRDGSQRIHLFFKVGPNPKEWVTYWMHLNDDGDWSSPTLLVQGDSGGRGPVKNKPIVLSDGTWLAPASTEHHAGSVPPPLWRPFADRSDDGGLTWNRSADFLPPMSFAGKGSIQPTFWESEPGHVHALLRSGSGLIWRADSLDNGETWSALYETKLPNNNSGIDLVKLPDGRLILALNPIGVPFGFRNILTLALSEDNGTQWRAIGHLEFSYNPFDEFSYPSIIVANDELVVSHTWLRQRIKLWRIPLSSL